MRDSPTAQLPLLRAVGGNRERVTVSPTSVALTDGRTSTEAETRTPAEEGEVSYLEPCKCCLLCLNPKQNLLSIKSSKAAEISSLFIMYQWSADVWTPVPNLHIYQHTTPPHPYLHVSQVFELTTTKGTL